MFMSTYVYGQVSDDLVKKFNYVAGMVPILKSYLAEVSVHTVISPSVSSRRWRWSVCILLDTYLCMYVYIHLSAYLPFVCLCLFVYCTCTYVVCMHACVIGHACIHTIT